MLSNDCPHKVCLKLYENCRSSILTFPAQKRHCVNKNFEVSQNISNLADRQKSDRLYSPMTNVFIIKFG